ncbi:MAG TPA: thiamine pyrophosphate-dependent dehydrogenase E1 component subunit alpha [Candidatus Limnocylindrales bacterium]|jgi:pyruvate dehydrogenase E1 component alpha subunit|nr:thiamine pyrophosphate-dependent dehydrogenase E1 component subunit alpha [Candidatus Limnocylindrales bacterium]
MTDRLAWYRMLVRIRLFEDKVQELFQAGLIQGTTHLCQGQEAVSVGAIAAMHPGDVQTNTYRGHGEALALGMAPETAFAELMGRSTGGSGGVGGSMHLIDFSKGNIGANAIVGAGLPIAVGAAVAFQMQHKPNVALAFFGDGATNIGTFHEALNMAAIWSAPVVFIVANNLYGEYSPLRTTTPLDDLARRADPYGMPGIIVDGQDVDAVNAATAEAVERARGGDGPSLLEMKTYRYRGHSRSDPAKYRPAGELDAWRARDPIEILGARLVDDGEIASGDPPAIRQEIQAEIDAAAERAAAAPYPTLEETRPYVYAD